MSKYETTNAQYCVYLNAAKASGDVTVDGDYVKGSSGPYSGQNYYYLAGSGYTYNDATNGGAARISGSFRVIRGGGWSYYDNGCTVSSRFSHYPFLTSSDFGFRVCR